LRFSLPGLLRCDQNFRKLGIKENFAERVKQIEEIEITADCEFEENF